VLLPQYSDTNEFTPPEGVEMVKIDKATNLLSDAACPDDLLRGLPRRHRAHGYLRPPGRPPQHAAKDLRPGQSRPKAATERSSNAIRSSFISVDVCAVGHGLAARAPEGDARIRP
jgi:hypothetical protein